jgi:hypothetical protein
MILWPVIEDREADFEIRFFIERRLVGLEARFRDVNRMKSNPQLVLGAQGGSIIQRGVLASLILIAFTFDHSVYVQVIVPSSDL